MHCGTCTKKFSIIRSKKQCSECRNYYCKYCLTRKANKHLNCEICEILTSRPLNRTRLLRLKVRDLQVYLNNKNVSTRGCIEKEDLVNLVLAYASSDTDHSNASTPEDRNSTRQMFDNLKSYAAEFMASATSSASQASNTFKSNPNNGDPSPENPNNPSQSSSRSVFDNVRSYFNADILTNLTGGNNGNSSNGSNYPNNSTTRDYVANRPPDLLDQRNHEPLDASDRSPLEQRNVATNQNQLSPPVSPVSNVPTAPEFAMPIVTSVTSPTHQQSFSELDLTMLGVVENDWEYVSSSLTDESLLSAGNAGPSHHHGSGSRFMTDSTQSLPTIIDDVSPTSSLSNANLSTAKDDLHLSDIKTVDQLDGMSVRQLKLILVRNRVDFKGCVEKAELLQRARRLWHEYRKSREDVENMPLDDLCKICMDAPIECVILECGHMATCTLCAKNLCECPICRQFVVRVVRTFRT